MAIIIDVLFFVLQGRPCLDTLGVCTHQPLQPLQSHQEDVAARWALWSGSPLRPVLRSEDGQGMDEMTPTLNLLVP